MRNYLLCTLALVALAATVRADDEKKEKKCICIYPRDTKETAKNFKKVTKRHLSTTKKGYQVPFFNLHSPI